MIQSLTVTNYLGDSIKLDLMRPEDSGFIVKSITGIGPNKADINVTDLAGQDGGYFNSSKVQTRNIKISLLFMWNDSASIETIRQKSYKYFPIKRGITLTFETDNRVAKISGYVESNEPNIFSKSEGTDISIICPDPNFYSASENNKDSSVFAGIEPMFEFPFFNDITVSYAGELSDVVSTDTRTLIMSERRNKTENVITYSGDADIGITITIHSIGEVSGGITIYNTKTREIMKIDTNKIKSLTGTEITTGDTIIICTVTGKKRVSLLRGGRTTNILSCLDKNADWFKVTRGDNLFAYTAGVGSENLQFTIDNDVIYEGI